MNPNPALADTYLEVIVFRFENMKSLGDKALAQCDESDLHFSPGPESNSIAVIVQHLHGNMLSRWTDFLTSDGDKPWRDREGEFDETKRPNRDEVMRLWDEGWACLMQTIHGLRPEDLLKQVTIRGQALGVLDAIERQHGHYSYHIGQIVYLARMRKGSNWQTLSITKGASGLYKPTKRD